jgi:hypothetical protein
MKSNCGTGEHMMNLDIGDRVSLRGRPYVVRGISPMSVAARRVHLEAADTGERVEASIDDVQRVGHGSRMVPPLTRLSDEMPEQ